MIQNVVCAKVEHVGFHPRLGGNQTIPVDLVLRYGYCDFENDGTFDAVSQKVIAKEFTFNPEITTQDWYWDGSAFQEEAE